MGGAKKIVKKIAKPAIALASPGTALVEGLSKQAGLPTLGGMLSPQQIAAGGGSGGYTDMASMAMGLAPTYENLRDETGALKKQFQYDPTKSAAFGKLQEQAMAAPGDSPWAKMQMQKQALEQTGAADQAALSQAQGLAQAQGNLMRQGGLGSGARTRMAMQGARDLAAAQQGVAGAGIKSRLGIQEQDIGRQQDALGKISSTELEAQGKNLASIMGDVSGKAQFDMEKYKQQMGVLGANRTADAQEKAANKSGKK